MPGIDDPLVGVAGYGLPGRTLALPQEPLSEPEWNALINGVWLQRIPGLLVRAVADGAFAATPAQSYQAEELAASSMFAALLLERTLVQTAELLRERGCDHRVLKGPAVAHLVYPDPSWRSFGDIDLLIRGDQFDEVVAVLLEAGCHRHHPEVRSGFDRRFGKGTTMIAEDRVELDLHRTFVGGRFGLSIKPAALFATSTPFCLAGRRLLALGHEEQFLHACYHGALGDRTPRLNTLRDIAQDLLSGRLDADRAMDIAVSWRGEPVLARGVILASDTLALPELGPLLDWARRYRPTAAEERALETYTTRRSGGAQALSALPVIPGIRAKTAFIYALAVPQRSFMQRKQRCFRVWWRRGGRAVLQVVRRR